MRAIRKIGHMSRELEADEAFGSSRFCSVGVAVGAAVVGSVYTANKAAGAQKDATKAQSKAADESNALSKERFDWEKKVYEQDTRPMQLEDQALKKKVIDAQLAQSEKQAQFADEQNEYYEQTFKPVEQQMVKDASEYDSSANINKRSGMAAANVNQQFSNAAAQQSRLMGRYGLSSSGAFKNQARDQALATVGAQNGAAFDTMDKAISLRAGAANFGRNMPNTAASYYAGSTNSGNSASAASTGALSNQMASTSGMSGAYGNRISGINSYGNTMANVYNAQAQQWGSVASGLGSMAGGGASYINSTSNPTFMGLVGGMLSDRRAKKNIRRVGQTDDGLPIYTYEYKDGGPTQMGVIAQEVAEVKPEAVVPHESGMLAVDYSKID